MHLNAALQQRCFLVPSYQHADDCDKEAHDHGWDFFCIITHVRWCHHQQGQEEEGPTGVLTSTVHILHLLPDFKQILEGLAG